MKENKMLIIFILVLPILLFFFNTNKENYMRIINSREEFESIETGYVFFGSDDCFACKKLSPILKKYCKKNKTRVNYFNINYLRKNEIYTNDEIEKIVKKFEIEYIPLIVKVENKYAVSRLSFNYRKMDSSKINKELYNYFEKNRK